MVDLKTPPALLEALRKAATRDLTASELHSQKVSFIMGMVNEKSGITRSQVEKELAHPGSQKGA